MGKSGKKKKAGVSQNQSQTQASDGANQVPSVAANGGIKLDPAVFLKRAHELKEEGNKRYQAKDFAGALEQYEKALKLIPAMHPDKAVFHSNKAACLMQMKPVDYDLVIVECSLALRVQPGYVRALLRRARAYEAIGKYEIALQDVKALLNVDPKNGDALEIFGRLRAVLGPRQDAQQDLQSRPSPAALGASAVRGAPVGLGPSLPSRPVGKKPVNSSFGTNLPSNKSEKLYPIPHIENGPTAKSQLPQVSLKLENGPSKSATMNDQKDSSAVQKKSERVAVQYRPLKLVYDHDIRLAQMPVNCSFKVLREMVVSKRYPMSKSVLIKYKDSDGDLVTITCTSELRLAEKCVDSLVPKDTNLEKGDSFGTLRLHIVEVSPEQEPPLLEEEEEKPVEDDPPMSETVDSKTDNAENILHKEKDGATEEAEFKEVEMDDWLFEFAQLFRTHVGIDADAHVDLHGLGMEMCSEALDETVTGEEAQSLFDKASLKFQEVAALAFFNWGNVHMCAARKRIPIDESAGKETMESQLQTAYDWVRDKYSLAKEKYEEALNVKPDFYEGLLALGQQQFEMAKLHWSFVLAKKEDLSKWDPTETINLFDSAEEKMTAATGMWEKLEEQRVNESKDPNLNKKDESSKRKKKQSGDSSVAIENQGELSPEEAAEQATAMRSQIHLFWGNMLFERSQVECKLGLKGWEKNLDGAVERFKLAGASETDISTVVKNHCSNVEEAAKGKQVEDSGAKAAENQEN